MNLTLKERFTRLILLGFAVVVPLLMTIQFVRAANAPAQQLRGGIVSKTLLLAQNRTGATSGTDTRAWPSTSPIAAVLYTNGTSQVSWNGKNFAVNDGSYAYVGGEVIQMGTGSIGLLQLTDGSSVFICGGSTVSLSRSSNGAHVLNVVRGSSRFSFQAGSDFSVLANNTNIGPASLSSGAPDGPFEGEVHARPDGGCVVCELARDLQVNSGGAKGPPAQDEPSGRIFAVSSDEPARGGPAISEQPIPARAMPASLSSGASPGAAFLCQCEQLKRRLDELTDPQVVAMQNDEADAQPQPPIVEAEPEDAVADLQAADEQAADEQAAQPALVQQSLQQEGPEQQLQPLADASTTIAPPVAPPDAPPLLLAEPGVPDPFDPDILPPPAVGEAVNPIVVVAPPVVPTSGSGGGGVASPS